MKNKFNLFLVVLIGVQLLNFSCKKKYNNTTRKISIESIPDIKITDVGDFWSSLITKSKKLIYSNGNNTYITNITDKKTELLDNTYYFKLAELSNGSILGITFNAMYEINPIDKTKKKVNFNQGSLDNNTILNQSKNGDLFMLIGGKFLKSTDQAMNWTDISNGNNYTNLCIIDNTIYVTLSGKIYKSTDGGNTFQNIASYPTNDNLGRLSISPTHEFYISLNSGGNYYSKDLGKTYNQINLPDQIVGVNLIFNFCGDGTVITSSYTAFGTRYKKVAVSKPGSTSFDLLSGMQLSVFSSFENITLIGGDEGLFLSEDYSKTWSTFGESSLIGYTILMENKNTLLARGVIGNYGQKAIFRLINGKWTVEPLSVNFIYFKNQQYVYYMPDFITGYYSTDNGVTFTKIDNAMENIIDFNVYKFRSLDDIITLKNGVTLGILRYDFEYQINGPRLSRIIKFNYTKNKWEKYAEEGGPKFMFNENANGNLFYEKLKSTDQGMTWNEIDIQYIPMSFNSLNNFVASHINANTIWFSDLTGSKIYEYTFEPSISRPSQALFDGSDYLYLIDNNKIYKSKNTVLAP